jgi:hypothetical protein
MRTLEALQRFELSRALFLLQGKSHSGKIKTRPLVDVIHA